MYMSEQEQSKIYHQKEDQYALNLNLFPIFKATTPSHALIHTATLT